MLVFALAFLAASRPAPGRAAVKELSGPLAGASFLEQAPNLAKESGLHTRQNSGWAMSGHPIPD